MRVEAESVYGRYLSLKRVAARYGDSTAVHRLKMPAHRLVLLLGVCSDTFGKTLKFIRHMTKMNEAVSVLMALCMVIYVAPSCSTDEEDELVGNWVKVSDFDGVARCSAVTFTVDGEVYVATGGYGGYKYRLNDLWVFNEDSGTWTQKASMEGAARTYAVGFGTDRYGYVGLGYDGDNYLKDFWKYDPSGNSWSKVSDFGGSARRAAVAFSVAGNGYVGCGYDGNHLKDFWRYDESSDSWIQITSIGGSKRMGASSFVIDDVAYVVGGENNSECVTDFWAFDPSGETWIEKRKISNVSDDDYDDDYATIARSYGVAFTMYGLGYLTCGENAGSGRNNTWEYDPVNDLWTERTSYEAGTRSEAVGFSINDRGFVLTGKSGTYQYDDMWEFHPQDEYEAND